MYLKPLFALFMLLLVVLASGATLCRLWSRAKEDRCGSRLLFGIVAFVSLFFAAFMVALEMHWLNWLWRINEVVIYRVVAIFYTLFIPLAAYGSFSLLDLIGKKLRPQNRWHLRGYIGIPLMLICFAVLVTGFLNRRHLEVERVDVESARLPEGFDDTKIVVLADLHFGTLVGQKSAYLQAIVDSVNALQPDFIFMVGDLVNIYANEMLGPHTILEALEARIGKYAVMGNHDYGGYFPFDNETEQQANELRMREVYEMCGFRLLENEGVEIAVGDTDKINVVGIENWGTGRFPKYGDLTAAMNTVSTDCYTILLSHDPTAWRPCVLASDYHVDLTVSGHTHGGQFIVFGLSPAMKEFEFWNGLYSSEQQYIYVSRGLGYTIVPMRVGRGPEISLIHLHKSVR